MYEYSCTVDRVVDGDTIDVTLDLGFDILFKSRVRLYAIDTPESRTRDKDEKARGKLASAYLQNAIDTAKQVIIRTELKDSRGKYGRVLGSVICDGRDINKAMVEQYYAVAYYGQNKQEVEETHLLNRTKLIKLGVFTPVEV
jgi:micrococcal nuclease|tara:strand:+ start:86 stop:511 length:426 start_codon:yes stop_codon:yes gene_type:complete